MNEKNLEIMPPEQGATTGREGFALVTTLLMVLVLSVLAVGVVWLASSEKKITFAEQNHISSLFSADAGGEAGINYVRLSSSPPRIIDWADSTVVNQGETNLHGSQNYDFQCRNTGKAMSQGWGDNYFNLTYEIDSNGSASTRGKSGVTLVVDRLYRLGY